MNKLTLLKEHSFLLENVIVWAILIAALFAYAMTLDLCMFQKSSQAWHDKSKIWQPTLQKILASLPLLGLLGTITGLMETFATISLRQGLAVEELLTGGIANALYTTQLGLVLVIPGLLLLHGLSNRIKRWEVQQAREIKS